MRFAPASSTGRGAVPGVRPRRSIGPEIEIAASSPPPAVEHRRGHRRHARLALADRLRPAAPADLGEQTRRELRRGDTSPSAAGSDHAHSTCAPEPAVSGNRAPTGTVVRSPDARSAAATHTRSEPSRR